MTKSGKYAVIDMGTNSVRLLLCTIDAGTFSHVEKEVNMTRLGKGVNETGIIEIERMDETVEVLERYVAKADSYGAHSVYLMATSAVRDARNSDLLKKKIYDRTTLVVDVISGEMEAEVGFAGVLAGENAHNKVMVIDIGGGSTELIVGDDTGIDYAVSLNVGAVRMTGKFLKTDPVATVELEAMRHEINQAIKEELEAIRILAPKTLVGIGGTAATYATMSIQMATYDRLALNGLFISLETIVQFNERLKKMSIEERKKIEGLESKRADIIFAGGIILELILEALGFDGFKFSDYDNLEGYLAKQLELNA